MRELLKTKERRQLEIVEYLLEASDWTTTNELALLFACTPRVIKADLTELREQLTQLRFESGYLGFRLFKDYKTSIQSIYSVILNESLAFQMLEELFFDETLSVEKLAEKFFVSQSTIYRTITQINDYFNETYQCGIEVTPCRFVGNEQNIRLFYRTYFSEKNSLMGWPFRDIDEEKINKMFDKILPFISTDMDLDFAYYEDIKLVVLVNKIRYDHHHLVETNGDDDSELLNLFLKIYKYTLHPLGLVTTMDLNRESFYQVFGPYIRKDAANNQKQLQKFKKKNDKKGDALRYLEQSLLQISKKYHLTIDVDYIIFGVHNTAINAMDLLNSDFILFDRNKHFVLKFKSYFPDLYNVFFKMIVGFCEKLGLSTQERTINYLLFTLLTYWDGLLSGYMQNHLQVSLVILSDQHVSHSKMLKNLLEIELPREINVYVYNEKKISEAILHNLPYDIIISNFTLPKLQDKNVVTIHDFPTTADLVNIKEMITSVRTKRQTLKKISDYNL